MIIKYSPQRSDVPLSYSISGDVITATLDGKSDTFDFTDLPAGRVATEIGSTVWHYQYTDEQGVTHDVYPCPVHAAERTAEGELIVTLSKYHGPNPTRKEAFPREEVI